MFLLMMPGEEDKELLQEMKNHVPNNNIKINDTILAAQATVFFLAGFETSATVLSFALLELAANPDIQRKAQIEIDEKLAQCDGKVAYESLAKMKFLDWILEESMRKYPPLTVHLRVCTKPYTIPGTTVSIDEGTLIVIPNYALQNDSKYFPDPERFEPERFSDEDRLQKYQYIYTPFGEGPRKCIGSRFANVQSKMALLLFLKKYTVSFVEKTVYPVKFNTTQFVLTPTDGIWLKLEHRVNE